MRKSNSREQFLQAASRLLREGGYAATGINEIVAESRAPKGSLYFHFPGGKEEIVALALSTAGDLTCEAIRASLANCTSVIEGVQQVFLQVLAELEKTEFHAGCPIGAVAVESPDSSRINEVVKTAFGLWQQVLKERLNHAGASPRRAGELAEFILVQFEGALVLAKAMKRAKPILNALREIKLHLLQEGIQ